MMTRSVILLLFLGLVLPTHIHAQSCEKVVHVSNVQLSPKIDEQELIEILRSLNSTNNKKLPPKFVIKQEAVIG